MPLIPDWEDLERLVPPLEPGEKLLATIYDRLQSEVGEDDSDMKVYCQPYLGNDRADLVVVDSAKGILVWEVKDWHPREKPSPQRRREAFRQVIRYRSILIALCWPAVEDLLANESLQTLRDKVRGFLRDRVQCGVFFSKCQEDYVNQWFLDQGRRRGIHYIRGNDLSEVVPPRPVDTPTDLPPELKARVWSTFVRIAESWLTPPFHRWEQGASYTLNPDQKRHIAYTEPGRYRIQGPAGSGKSLVLSHKAAKCASEGKRVLFVCFNIALRCYLEDLLSKAPYDFSRSLIKVIHYHRLRWDLIKETGAEVGPDGIDLERVDTSRHTKTTEAVLLREFDEKYY